MKIKTVITVLLTSLMILHTNIPALALEINNTQHEKTTLILQKAHETKTLKSSVQNPKYLLNIVTEQIKTSIPNQFSVKEEQEPIRNSYTNEAGTRPYELYIPSSVDGSKKVPLIVMLHGCSQSAKDIAAGTEMNTLADENEFIVLYPEQISSANTNKCWNWFEPIHQKRGSGEPSIIAEMTELITEHYPVDPKKVYMAGMSAGGAMTTIMGATYPDLYAAIGVGAGLEYEAGTDLITGLVAMQLGGPNPSTQGEKAYNAMSKRHRPMPLIVFHGEADATVSVKNAHQVIDQWGSTNDLADDKQKNKSITSSSYEVQHDQVEGGYQYTKSTYYDSKREPIMEKWIVSEMTHKWSGGSLNGSYTDPKGPKASVEMLRFFLNYKLEYKSEELKRPE